MLNSNCCKPIKNITHLNQEQYIQNAQTNSKDNKDISFADVLEEEIKKLKNKKKLIKIK